MAWKFTSFMTKIRKLYCPFQLELARTRTGFLVRFHRIPWYVCQICYQWSIIPNYRWVETKYWRLLCHPLELWKILEKVCALFIEFAWPLNNWSIFMAFSTFQIFILHTYVRVHSLGKTFIFSYRTKNPIIARGENTDFSWIRLSDNTVLQRRTVFWHKYSPK